MAPTEHVHETTGPDGHHETLAHTHASAHPLDIHPHHDGAALDDDDSVILTLDPVFAVPQTYVLMAPASSVVRLILEDPTPDRVVPVPFVERLIHGPPRAPSILRGPPISSLL
jgi:hypothetical protein